MAYNYVPLRLLFEIVYLSPNVEDKLKVVLNIEYFTPMIPCYPIV